MSTNLSSSRLRVPRFAEEAVERARLTVVPPLSGRPPTAPFIILVMAILVSGVLGLLAFNTSMQDKAFETTRLQAKADALKAKRQRLALELSAMRDPQALASRAKRMGMVPPPAPAFLSLKDGTVKGDAQPAVGGAGIQINQNPSKKPPALNPKPIVVKVPASSSMDLSGTPQTAHEVPAAPQDGATEAVSP